MICYYESEAPLEGANPMIANVTEILADATGISSHIAVSR